MPGPVSDSYEGPSDDKPEIPKWAFRPLDSPQQKTATQTFTATIYVGLRAGYDGALHQVWDATAVCQGYVNQVGLGVSVTPTSFVYTDGFEPGVIVGLINYPRFPSNSVKIREHALALAALLKERLGQKRVSVVFPDETVMLGEKD